MKNKNLPKKPPAKIVSIAGQLDEDIVTQKELAEISDMQAAEWVAAQSAHRAVLRLIERLKAGAKIEDGTLTFDRELRMVRSRKKAGAG